MPPTTRKRRNGFLQSKKSLFIKNKDKLEELYASLQKGQLISVEHKENNGYTNIYGLMDRSYADRRKSAQRGQEAEAKRVTGRASHSFFDLYFE
ncbi:hypothetical protein BC8716_09670 [Shouchella clausii]|uniref:Uncharacterized protein n=1 Tax=Shouchella clausii TaxID=79880 RepID=A0A268RUK8_SHOCL|nr:hypothetical protein BC8716_09670 [Shouchella clausii]PAD15369.1 hypothetical protein CHH74_06405 [Shouchella clausii]PAF23945.1 hypothetical protein CHH61_21300 [Shouchella clausii]PTL20834.1 hypothetical protein DA802_21155 [Shouchella clausii]QNM42555.1 hypothetical protein DUT88_06520 [Shouchella clausii]